MRVKMFFVAVFFLLLGIVIVQNTEIVTVRFLMWDVSMSRIVLLLVATFAGFLFGFSVAKIGSHGPRMKSKS